jgi:P-type Ca2+ transporter type 2C
MMSFLNSESACTISSDEVSNILKCDLKNGLSEVEVMTRRKLYGFNEFAVKNDEPLWKKYLEKFKEPMILLLLASAMISIIMNQLDDAISITFAILIVVTVAFIQVNSMKFIKLTNKQTKNFNIL